MSKNEALSTIENTDLTTVCGGLEVKGKGKVDIGVGKGTVEGEFEYKRVPYESCIAGIMDRKKPDGSPDWTPEQLKNACGLPPA